MGHRTLRPVLVVALVGVFLGCAPETAELEAEPQGWPEEESHEGRGRFVIEGESLELGYRALNGHLLFEGDIILDDEVEPLAGAGEAGVVAEPLLATSSRSGLWPRAVVPYTIHASVTTPGRVRSALRTWEATGIQFVPRTSQRAYVTFIEDPGHPVCSAQVGHNGGHRYVYLRDTDRYEPCSESVLVHEVGHVLGLWHEHTRTDRDAYVTIHWRYVPSAYREAYEIKTSGVRRVGAYDITSSMHYRSTTLTRAGGSAITRRDGTRLLHDWATLSRGDVAAIRTLYFDGTPVPRAEAPSDGGARDAAAPRDAGPVARDAGPTDAGRLAVADAGVPDASTAYLGAPPLPTDKAEEVEASGEPGDERWGDDLEERSLEGTCSAAPGGRGSVPLALLVLVLVLSLRVSRRVRRRGPDQARLG